MADAHLPPHDDPLSAFASEPPRRRERVLEFAWEPPPPRERLIEFEPEWRGPGESTRLTEQALPPASRGRWFMGAVMLGAGLVAGFAGGVAVTRSGGDQNVLVRSQPPPPQPVDVRPADDPIAPLAPATNDSPQTAEAVAATPEPKPLITGPRVSGTPASAKPVETIPITALYVQSNPAGAEVYLDDRLVSTTPFQMSDIAPGRYTIRIDMQGYRPWSAEVSVESRARTSIAAVLER